MAQRSSSQHRPIKLQYFNSAIFNGRGKKQPQGPLALSSLRYNRSQDYRKTAGNFNKYLDANVFGGLKGVSPRTSHQIVQNSIILQKMNVDRLNGTLSFSKSGPGNINQQLLKVVQSTKLSSLLPNSE